MAAVAVVLRVRDEARFHILLDAASLLLLGCALFWVIARAVFAPGFVTYYRIVGAVLLYLTIGLMFVALYTNFR
jgi:hypothetical protein